LKRRGNYEGSLYKRKDGRWVAAITMGYSNGRRQRKTAVATSKMEAKKRLAELQHRAEQGLSLDPDPTLADYLDRWLDESARRKVRPRTFAGYLGIVRGHLTPALGRIRLTKLRPADVEACLSRAADSGLSRRRVQYVHAVLRAALSHAERWELVSRNVAKLVTPAAPTKRDVAPLRPQEARRLLESVAGDRLEALYAVSLSLGLRQSEALGLTWECIDFDAGTLSVRKVLQRYGGAYHLDEPKTQRSRRTIALPTPLVDVLRRHRVRQNEERLRAGPHWPGQWDLVFCRVDGQPLAGTEVTRQFQRRLAQLGLPRQRWHDQRHAAASFLLSQGVPLRTIMSILGHSTIAVTSDLYAHVAVEMQRDATDRVGSLLWGQAQGG
jgi:integrase